MQLWRNRWVKTRINFICTNHNRRKIGGHEHNKAFSSIVIRKPVLKDLKFHENFRMYNGNDSVGK